jgi:hypothetical protein
MSRKKRNDFQVGLLALPAAALGIISACGLAQPVTIQTATTSSAGRQGNVHGAPQGDKNATTASGDSGPSDTGPDGKRSGTEATTDIKQNAVESGAPVVLAPAVVAAPAPVIPAVVATPAADLAPGILTVSDCSFPSNIRSNQSVSVSFTVSNSGAPVTGFYGTVRVQASVNMFGQVSNVDRSFPIDSKETVPSGQTSKTMSFTAPSIPVSTTANVCVRAFSDAARSVSISSEICRDVKVN